MNARLGKNLSRPWLRSSVEPFRAHAAVALVLGFSAAACAALLMFTSGYLICRTAEPATTLFMVMVPVALVQVFGLARPLARYFERLVSHDWVFRVTSRLRVLLFGAAEALADDPSSARAIGEYLGLVGDGIANLQNLYLRVAFPTIVATLLVCAGTVFCGVLSPLVGLAFFAFASIAAIVAPCIARIVARPLQARAKATSAREYAQLADDVMGTADWTLSGRYGEARRAHEALLATALDSDRAVRRVVSAAQLASAIILAGGACALVAAAAGAFAPGGDASLVTACVLGFFPVAEVIAMLPDALVDALSREDAVARLDDVVSPLPFSAATAVKRKEASAAEDARYAVEVAEVTYRYPQSSRAALEKLSLAVPCGQKLALLGRSGSGKTTLARLMRGALTPDKGHVHVCGSRADSTDQGTSAVGYVPQSPYLFDRTLRGNLLVANPAATDTDLEEALRIVGLGGKLESLACGLDTPIGETGAAFSGGEAHRLALARTLLADFPIVLLDEPFAGLDPATEAALLDTLFSAFSDKTIIVITHHLAHIERFDRVAFIEEGRLKLDGSPHDLARDEPYFKQLLAFDRGL